MWEQVQETWQSMLPHIQAIQVGHSTNPSGDDSVASSPPSLRVLLPPHACDRSTR
jgi:hypothetical protein